MSARTVNPLPISAEARGRYRTWRAEQKQIAAAVKTVFHEPETARLAGDLVLKRRLGRKRALRLLEERYTRAGARLFRVDGSPWFAFIGFCRYADRPGDYVQVRAVTIGMSGSWIIPWAVQFEDHALMRAVQRWTEIDLTRLVWSAHESARGLDLPRLIEAEQRLEARGSCRRAGEVSLDRFRIKGDVGAFACELVPVTHPTSTDTWLVHAKTWLSDEQMHSVQELEIVEGGTDGERLDGLIGLMNYELHGGLRKSA